MPPRSRLEPDNDLLDGLHEWRPVQEIVRLTFKALHDVVRAQAEAIRNLEKALGGKLGKSEHAASLAEKVNISELSQTFDDLSKIIDAKLDADDAASALDSKADRSSTQAALQIKADHAEVQRCLDAKADVEEVQRLFDEIEARRDASEVRARALACVSSSLGREPHAWAENHGLFRPPATHPAHDLVPPPLRLAYLPPSTPAPTSWRRRSRRAWGAPRPPPSRWSRRSTLSGRNSPRWWRRDRPRRPSRPSSEKKRLAPTWRGWSRRRRRRWMRHSLQRLMRLQPPPPSLQRRPARTSRPCGLSGRRAPSSRPREQNWRRS